MDFPVVSTMIDGLRTTYPSCSFTPIWMEICCKQNNNNKKQQINSMRTNEYFCNLYVCVWARVTRAKEAFKFKVAGHTSSIHIAVLSCHHSNELMFRGSICLQFTTHPYETLARAKRLLLNDIVCSMSMYPDNHLAMVFHSLSIPNDRVLYYTFHSFVVYPS